MSTEVGTEVAVIRQNGYDVEEAEGISWVNASGAETADVRPYAQRVAREIAHWVKQAQGASRPSFFNRAAYVSPDNPYSQMSTARSAVENDDIVGGVCDVTEGLGFQGLKWESEDPVATDIFNQMATDLDLDEFVRQWHREDFTYSQTVIGVWWGIKEYKPKAKTETGKKSKKLVRVACPVAWTFLNPQHVVPLRPGPFGEDRLAWHATNEEWADATAGFTDPLLAEFTTGKITINSLHERDMIQRWGMDPNRLLGLNPNAVFRLSRTKVTYERFPVVRLKSVFPLLDLKQQLLDADRVSLVGAANFILLVKQGTKEEPAKQMEIDNLKENFKVVAKLPVVVGDHRLAIEIITPEQNHVLMGGKYDVIDQRILARTLGALLLATTGGQSTDTSKGVITRGISRHLENRRHMMKRCLEKEFARRVMDHPFNAGLFEHEPNLVFIPRGVQIESDAELSRSIMALRSSKDLSRESTLEYFGFDQAAEALRREFEADNYDDTFGTIVPFSSPDQGGAPSQVTGTQGGRPKGGGDSPQSPQGQSGGRSPSGQKTPTKSK